MTQLFVNHLLLSRYCVYAILRHAKSRSLTYKEIADIDNPKKTDSWRMSGRLFIRFVKNDVPPDQMPTATLFLMRSKRPS